MLIPGRILKKQSEELKKSFRSGIEISDLEINSTSNIYISFKKKLINT